MAQSFTQKKINAANNLIAISKVALPIALNISEFVSEITDSGFLTGGANPITDAELQANASTAHLTAALLNSAVAALGTITLSTANKTTLRQTLDSTISSIT